MACWTGCKSERQVRGFEALDRVAGCLSKDLAPTDQGNGVEVRIDEPIGSHDDMKWIILFVDQCWCLCSINIGGDGMEYARQGIIVGHFISPVIGV